ncbi:MAG: hypothetical protein JSW38_00015 [Dehalococcoidia bacterium]|nr:MAG: hypothetical protein JSW38_00015 [Dehalococcoidia bacterium]
MPYDKPPSLNNTLNYVKVDCRLRHILPELTPTDRSVLFSYGLRVNKESVSFVSVETLLKEAKRTPNMCRISRKKLVEMGLLRLVEQGGGAGKVSKYQVKYFTRGKNTPRLIML